jgi:hypothetical protein
MRYGIYLWMILVSQQPQIDSVYVLPHDSVVCAGGRFIPLTDLYIEPICDTIRVGNYWQKIKRVNGRLEYVK